jgi:hypothetical protein
VTYALREAKPPKNIDKMTRRLRSTSTTWSTRRSESGSEEKTRTNWQFRVGTVLALAITCAASTDIISVVLMIA